jgi:hypothetical protein
MKQRLFHQREGQKRKLAAVSISGTKQDGRGIDFDCTKKWKTLRAHQSQPNNRQVLECVRASAAFMAHSPLRAAPKKEWK